MLTVAKLLEVIDGLDPDAQVVVGIINGPTFVAAYAEQVVRGMAHVDTDQNVSLTGINALTLHICCYEQARPWEGPPFTLDEDGNPTLRYDPEDDESGKGGVVMDHPHERRESFHVDDSGALVRTITPVKGEPYAHRCGFECYESTAYAIAEADGPFTLKDLRCTADAPWTQMNVALAFLKERSVVIPSCSRMHIAAGTCTFEDAMIEYHALREKGPADPAFGYEAP